MRRFAILAASAALFITAASADDSVMASRFGNTTITKDTAGNEVHIYYNDDHTFGIKIGNRKSTGSWKINGNTICLTYDEPDMVPKGTSNPTCLPVAAHKVGDSWGAGPYTVSLVAGIR